MVFLAPVFFGLDRYCPEAISNFKENTEKKDSLDGAGNLGKTFSLGQFEASSQIVEVSANVKSSHRNRISSYFARMAQGQLLGLRRPRLKIYLYPPFVLKAGSKK